MGELVQFIPHVVNGVRVEQRYKSLRCSKRH
jgi:hypothetical protein